MVEGHDSQGSNPCSRTEHTPGTAWLERVTTLLNHWQDSHLASRRVWLREVQPHSTEDDLSMTVYHWGSDCDDALTARRAEDPLIASALTVAEQGGIAIVPAWIGSEPHPLMEMASTTDDVDWVILTARDSNGDFTAGMLADATTGGLVTSWYQRHQTPRWCLRVASHA